MLRPETLHTTQNIKHQDQQLQECLDQQCKQLEEQKQSLCTKCGRKFSSTSTLNRHVKVAHELWRKYCEICHKGFTHEYGFKLHMEKMHPYKSNGTCAICDEVFPSENALCRHMQKEHKLTQKPFSCKECDKTFLYKGNLKRHERIEHQGIATKLKYVKCSKCQQQLSSMADLRTHQTTLHPSLHKCPKCNKEYQFKECVAKHIRKVHNTSDNIKCSFCDVAFSDYKMLCRHWGNNHKILRKNEMNSKNLPPCFSKQSKDKNYGTRLHNETNSESSGKILLRSPKYKLSKPDACKKMGQSRVKSINKPPVKIASVIPINVIKDSEVVNKSKNKNNHGLPTDRESNIASTKNPSPNSVKISIKDITSDCLKIDSSSDVYRKSTVLKIKSAAVTKSQVINKPINWTDRNAHNFPRPALNSGQNVDADQDSLKMSSKYDVLFNPFLKKKELLQKLQENEYRRDTMKQTDSGNYISTNNQFHSQIPTWSHTNSIPNTSNSCTNPGERAMDELFGNVSVDIHYPLELTYKTITSEKKDELMMKYNNVEPSEDFRTSNGNLNNIFEPLELSVDCKNDFKTSDCLETPVCDIISPSVSFSKLSPNIIKEELQLFESENDAVAFDTFSCIETT